MGLHSFSPAVPLLPAPMLPRLALLAALLVGPGLLGGGASCGSIASSSPPSAVTGDASALDTARVGRVDVPARIAPTDTLRIHLSGTVGPNGCYSLARIEAVRAPGQVTVTPLVQPPTADDQACTMAVVPLDTTYAANPPFEPGRLSITVPQRDRSPVTDTITVTDQP